MNHGASVDGNSRGVYMSQTSQSTYHEPCGCGRLLGLYIDSRPVQKSFHGDERGDIIGDNGSGGFRSQETIQSFFINY